MMRVDGAGLRSLSSPELVFRCDGSTTIGFGHLMRSIAIAEAARRRGFRPRFVIAPDQNAERMLTVQGFPVEHAPADLAPAEQASWLARQLPAPSWLVVDGYPLAAQIPTLRRAGHHVLAVDDSPSGSPGALDADVVVDPSLVPPRYSASGTARFLAGPRYAPLRPAFRQFRLAARDPRRQRSPRPRVLLLSGGSDVAGLVPIALAALADGAAPLPALDLTVVLGPGVPMPDRALLDALTPRGCIELVRTPREIASLMVSATVAVTAAGTSVLELLCLGIPAVVVTVVDNQAGVGAAVQAAGAGIDLGTPAAVRPASLAAALSAVMSDRARMSAAGRALVDGGGARRIVAALTQMMGRERAPARDAA